MSKVVWQPAFDAVGATGDLCVTLTAALEIARRWKMPVIVDRGVEKGHGSGRRFEWSADFQGGKIVWVQG